jgi:hypothetical protein
MPAKLNNQTIAGFAFGVIFVIVILILAIYFPTPTQFQFLVFKSVLSLAAAGVAATIPGTLGVEIPRFVRASGAIAVLVLVYFYNPAELVVPSARKPSGYTYELLETVFMIDLTTRMPTGTNSLDKMVSKVAIDRRDKIRKLTDEKEDFSLYFGTNGHSIEWEAVVSPFQARYDEIRDAGRFRASLKHNYNYILSMKDKPSDKLDEKPTEVYNRFTFWNAFQNDAEEWWGAEIRYPTRKAIMVFVFPETKPCKTMRILLRRGESNEVDITAKSPAVILKGGKYAFWTGDDLEGHSRYIFNWSW